MPNSRSCAARMSGFPVAWCDLPSSHAGPHRFVFSTTQGPIVAPTGQEDCQAAAPHPLLRLAYEWEQREPALYLAGTHEHHLVTQTVAKLARELRAALKEGKDNG